MPGKPAAGKPGHLPQCARFLEQMGGAGDDFEAAIAGQPGQGEAVQRQHLRVVRTHDQQGGRGDAGQIVDQLRKIGDNPTGILIIERELGQRQPEAAAE